MVLGKKGDAHTMETVTNWIFFAVVILIFVGILGGAFFTMMQSSSDNAVCKEAVYMSSVNRNFDLPPLDLPCPPGDVIISEIEDEAIYKKLAETQLGCMNTFGHLPNPLFDPGKGNEELYCVICDYIEFEDKTLAPKEYPLWLMVHNVPGKRITYWEYFTGEKPNKQTYADMEQDIKNNPDKYEIVTSKEYANLYVMGTRNGWLSKWDITLGSSVVGGVIFGLTAAGPLSGGSTFVVAMIITGIVAGGAAGYTHSPGSPPWHEGMAIIEFTDKGILAQECTRFGQ